ncbi:MAG: hypothetical protein ACERKK_11415 [Poseidonibacter sp.]|uniref:hypothetical protein n=1 Tax=Poseidonibacter sp. TaxID=2321188 RepID=UPI00359D9E50
MLSLLMDIISLFLLFIVIEYFESKWQKADNIHNLLLNNYSIYKQNIFLYFLLNSSFIYSIFLTIYLNNYTFLMISIVAVKFFDILFKISIMQKISKNIDLNEIIPNIPMGFAFRYLNLFIYPLSFLASIYL